MMDENEGGIKFVNYIGSDIDLWLKRPCDEKFNFETCLLYDEPEYHDPEVEEGSTWKFFDHITKRHLLGNGEEIFHYQKYERLPTIVKIYTPLYTLQELCTNTICTRLLANNVNETDVNDLEIPKVFKKKLNSYIEDLEALYDADGDECAYDWTTHYEAEYGS